MSVSTRIYILDVSLKETQVYMNQQSFIYKFLLSPQYRVWRHISIILFFIIISLNQALVGYKYFIPSIGHNIYWIIIGTILLFLVTVYLFLKIIVPKYLLKGRYIQFALFVLLYSLIYTLSSNLVYYKYMDGYDFFSENIIMDNLSSFFVFVFCIPGLTIPIFLRNWMIWKQHLNELKIKKESSQIEQLKEQINPSSFFKVLTESRSLVNSDPNKASDMLMRLGQLLRYQLYDCNRAQVLLTAEISFLRNFLELEKLCSSKLNYTMTTEGNVNGTFILPSVLLPFVQSVISSFDDNQELWSINISVNDSDTAVYINLELSGISDSKMMQKELVKVRRRLDTLYKGHYNLTVSNGEASQAEVVLLLDKNNNYADKR